MLQEFGFRGGFRYFRVWVCGFVVCGVRIPEFGASDVRTVYAWMLGCAINGCRYELIACTGNFFGCMLDTSFGRFSIYLKVGVYGFAIFTMSLALETC